MTDLMEEQIDIDELELPSELPVLPLKDTVVFPDSVLPLAIGQERSVRLVEDVVSGNRLIALVASKDREIEQPGWDDLYEVGTAAVVQKMIRVPDGSLRILVQGIAPHPPARPAPGRALPRRPLRRGRRTSTRSRRRPRR